MHKTSHDADAAMLSELPAATSFVTSIFLGRGEYARHGSANLIAARAIADQMTSHYQNGRRALVYAQLPSGRQFLVPDNYQPTEDTMTTIATKAFGKRFNAQRAAKSALGKDAEEGRDFETSKNAAGEWVWAKIEASPAATAELTPPDFSAKTHTRFRPKLAVVVAMVEARDVNGLRKFHINPSSTSPKAILRYRDRALAALTA